uniref:Uncharacterized protein n=1 Tax=Anguilla anguilla TaxID=7936 RepID=A0A0E9T258_ANGAN
MSSTAKKHKSQFTGIPTPTLKGSGKPYIYTMLNPHAFCLLSVCQTAIYCSRHEQCTVLIPVVFMGMRPGRGQSPVRRLSEHIK